MAEVADEGSRLLRVFGERPVYVGREVRVDEVDIGLPDGERVWREAVHLYGTASVVFLDEQDRVLLVWRHWFVQDRWCWEAIGPCAGRAFSADSTRRTLAEACRAAGLDASGAELLRLGENA